MRRGGVLLWELLCGRPPFSVVDSQTGNDAVWARILEFKLRPVSELPAGAAELVQAVLVRDINMCLGCGRAGAREVKRHRWFSQLDWNALERRKLPPPVRVKLRDKFDRSNYPKVSQNDLDHLRVPKGQPFLDPDPAWDVGF